MAKSSFEERMRAYGLGSMRWPWPDPNETRWTSLRTWLTNHPDASAEDVIKRMDNDNPGSIRTSTI
jgi:hypothetical protein